MKTLIPELKTNEKPKSIQEIPEITNNGEGPSVSLNSSRKNSKIIQNSRKKNISNINKSSLANKSTISTTPKQKQLVVQNHYLNKEKNSYSALMKQKKQENSQSYTKLVNASNIDLKIEKSVLGNNSFIISPMGKGKNIKKEIERKPKSHLTQISKDSLIKSPMSLGYKGNFVKKTNLEEKRDEKNAFQIDLNLNLQNFKKNKKLSKENVRSENFIQNQNEFENPIETKEILKHNEESSCQESGDEILISNVKVDVENLKNKMILPERYVKSPIENTQGFFIDVFSLNNINREKIRIE